MSRRLAADLHHPFGGVLWFACFLLVKFPLGAAQLTGAAEEIGTNYVYSGSVLDYVLLTGSNASVTADPGQWARVFFIDKNDDVLTVEFYGAGTLSFALADASGPAAPVKYNDGGKYMKGHASLTITNSDDTTTLRVAAVGAATPWVNPAVIRDDVDYDGMPDLARVTITSPSKKIHSVFTNLVRYSGSSGEVGIIADDIHIPAGLYLHDIDASGSATPTLRVGYAPEVRIMGGDFFQTNGAAVVVRGIYDLKRGASTDYHNRPIPLQPLRGEFSVPYPDQALVISPAEPAFLPGTPNTYRVPGYGNPAPSFRLSSLGNFPPWASLNPATGIITGTPPGTTGSPFEFDVSVVSGSSTSIVPVRLTVATPPQFTAQPASVALPLGGSTVLSATVGGAPVPTYQWRRDGREIKYALFRNLQFQNLEPGHAGLYSIVATNAAGVMESNPAIVGINGSLRLAGAASEVGSDIVHPSGNIFDQLLLEGEVAAITADPHQVTRLSYIDQNEDIVQVEFSGAGTLAVRLEDFQPPARPLFYNQAIDYVRGTARVVISGADETTNVSVFTVGRATAFNAALFRDNTPYDGVADLASIAIHSANGKFGGVRTANARFAATRGVAGLYAPNVQFTGPVFVGNVSASQEAEPKLILGNASDVRITGGNLQQPNGRPVAVKGITALSFRKGSTSHGVVLDAQWNQAVLEEDGVNVTVRLAQPPVP